MEIKNAHVVITGANRGIGRAFAKVCAEDKAHLHVVVRKKDATLVKELEAAGAASVTVWQGDLSSRQGVEKLLAQMESTKVDILFNNAGVAPTGLLEKQSTDDVYEALQTNLTALVHLTHALLPGMMKRRRGKIINNSSVVGLMHLPCATTYAASKAGVIAFTNSLRAELRGTGVSTLLLMTPAIKTRMLEDIEKNYSKDFRVPLGALSPQTYAKMIREAVLNDLEVVKPQGMTGLTMRVAHYLPTLFDWEVRRRFHRTKKSTSARK